MTPPLDHPPLEWPTQWYGCTQPERPWDLDASYYKECRGCVLAAMAALATSGDRDGVADVSDPCTLSDWVEYAIENYHPEIRYP